jgi:hypothetical protein
MICLCAFPAYPPPPSTYGRVVEKATCHVPALLVLDDVILREELEEDDSLVLPIDDEDEELELDENPKLEEEEEFSSNLVKSTTLVTALGILVIIRKSPSPVLKVSPESSMSSKSARVSMLVLWR